MAKSVADFRKESLQTTAETRGFFLSAYNQDRTLSSVDDFTRYVPHDIGSQRSSGRRGTSDNQIVVAPADLLENLDYHKAMPEPDVRTHADSLERFFLANEIAAQFRVRMKQD